MFLRWNHSYSHCWVCDRGPRIPDDPLAGTRIRPA